MSKSSIYLDNAATTQAFPEVVEAVTNALTRHYGNPSSLHVMGLEAERIVKSARTEIARALEVTSSEIYFTSGGTEGNNLVIKGAAKAGRGRHIITNVIEHSAVLNAVRDLEEDGYDVTRLPVDGEGCVDPDMVADAVSDQTVLVSVMAVNNEIGSIQPIEEIARKAKAKNENVRIHVDGVQAFGKIPLLPERWGIDFLVLSAHKLHGPKGVGAIYVRKGCRLAPLFGGGQQEGGLRSGTENVPGIAGFGAAVERIFRDFPRGYQHLVSLQHRLSHRLDEIEGAHRNGSTGDRSAPHILNYSFTGLRGEVLVHALEEKGVFVSTGSACSSRKGEVSHVLKALDLPEDRLKSSIRISPSHLTTLDDIDRAGEIIDETVQELRAFL